MNLHFTSPFVLYGSGLILSYTKVNQYYKMMSANKMQNITEEWELVALNTLLHVLIFP